MWYRNFKGLAILAIGLSTGCAMAHAQELSGQALHDKTFTTQAGYDIFLFNPEKMTCNAMAMTLSQIDKTAYRQSSGESVAPEDRALFAYEADVSALYYERCGVQPLAEPGQTKDGAFQRIITKDPQP